VNGPLHATEVGLKVGVAGVSICANGLPDWATAIEVLCGRAPFDPSRVRDPSPAALPANERRRLPATARMAIGLGLEALQAAGADPASTATVFASCGSDGAITHQICEALAARPVEVSPTRFHNSVHNAPAGYWSIALRTHAPSTSLCAFEDSFAAGLLEAAVQAVTEASAVLLVAYDLPYPEPLAALWSVPSPFGVALLLTPDPGHGLRLAIDFAAGSKAAGGQPVAPDALGRHPAAASLDVLALLAVPTVEDTTLRCHPGAMLRVRRMPDGG